MVAGLIGYGSDEEEEREKKRDDSRAGMEVGGPPTRWLRLAK